jgi:hypothetical protein
MGSSNSFIYDDAELLDMFNELEIENEIESAFQLDDRNVVTEFLLGAVFRSLMLISFVVLITALSLRFWWFRQFQYYQQPIVSWRKLEFWLKITGAQPRQRLTAVEMAKYLSFLNVSDTLIQEFAQEYSRALYSGRYLAGGEEVQREFVLTYRSIRNALMLWRLKIFIRKILRVGRSEDARIE